MVGRGKRGCPYRLIARRASGGTDTWYCSRPEWHGGHGAEHESEGGHRKWIAEGIDTTWRAPEPAPVPPGLFD